MEIRTVYFTNTGKENTDDTLQIARQRADELGIKAILVASTFGDTAAKAVTVFSNSKVIAVSHSSGFRNPNSQSFADDNRKIVEDNGGTILIATHAFAGIGRAMRNKFETYETAEVIAYTLRTFGQGMKVVCEIALMAADAGLIRTDEDAISIAGSGRGADTAVVLQPVNSHDFFDLKVKEILCKPRL